MAQDYNIYHIIIGGLILIIITGAAVMRITKPIIGGYDGNRETGLGWLGFFVAFFLIVGTVHIMGDPQNRLPKLWKKERAVTPSKMPLPQPGTTDQPTTDQETSTKRIFDTDYDVQQAWPITSPEDAQDKLADQRSEEIVPTTEDTFFFLPVGAFGSAENVSKAKAALIGNTKLHMTFPVEGKSLTKVGYGPFNTKAAALAFKNRHHLTMEPVQYWWLR